MKTQEDYKLPKADKDLENSIICTVISIQGAYSNVSGIIDADDFFYEENKCLFNHIKILFEKNGAIDPILLSKQVKESGDIEKIGGIIKIFSDNFISMSYVETRAKELKEYSMLRNLTTIGKELIIDANENNDPFNVVSTTLNKINNVSNTSSLNTFFKASETLKIKDKQLLENKGKGIRTGFDNLDNITNGLKSELIILAARPGMGKTAFALQIGYQVAKEKNVLFFSLEMTKESLISRIQSQISETPKSTIDNRTYNHIQAEQLEKADIIIDNMRLWIDDTFSQTTESIRFKCEKIRSQIGNIDLIIVDYLQLITGKGNNREQEISSISRSLKGLSKSMNCPVIALSQLSRALETRSDKRPLLSDLRESGSIEQDADKVLMMYRSKYYDALLEEDITEVIIRKQRDGSLGTLNYEFTGYCTKFTETDKVIEEEQTDHFKIDFGF